MAIRPLVVEIFQPGHTVVQSPAASTAKISLTVICQEKLGWTFTVKITCQGCYILAASCHSFYTTINNTWSLFKMKLEKQCIIIIIGIHFFYLLYLYSPIWNTRFSLSLMLVWAGFRSPSHITSSTRAAMIGRLIDTLTWISWLQF